MFDCRVVVALSLAALSCHGVEAQRPTLIADLDSRSLGDEGMVPYQLVGMGGAVYFSGRTREHGRELYRSTGGQPTLVADIVPGVAGSHPTALTVFGNRVAFIVNWWEVWVSDGTAANTKRLHAFDDTSGRTPGLLTAVGNRFFFLVGKSQGLSDLWVSDGTPAGTRMVRASVAARMPMSSAGNLLFFAGDTGGAGVELCRSDGTAAGTVLVKDVLPGGGGSRPHSMAAFGGRLVFSAAGPTGIAHWVSDGTPAGTSLLLDTNPSSDMPVSRAVLGGLLYFGSEEGTSGFGLWATAGTAATTRKVVSTGGMPRDLTVQGGRLFFADHGLWRSDGTAAGTRRLHSAPLSIRGASTSHVFFAVSNATMPPTDQPFATDGTAAGTVQLATSYVPDHGRFVATATGTVLFAASHAMTEELWRSDGTTAGTRVAFDYRPSSQFTRGSGADATVDFGDLVGGTTYSDGQNPETFVTDGTPAGTRRLMPGSDSQALLATLDGALYVAHRKQELLRIDPVTSSSTRLFGGAPATAFRLGDHLYFLATDTGQRAGVWRTDGCVAGTTLVKHFGPPIIAVTRVVSFKDSVYAAVSYVGGSKLWRIADSPAGTYEMTAGSPSPWSTVYDVYADGGRLLVSTAHGLLASDGTVRGASLLGPIGWRGSPVEFGGATYFLSMSSMKPALWRTDGTVAGTRIIKQIHSGVASHFFGRTLCVHRGAMYFYGEDKSGLELWRSDGTAAGTSLFKDIRVGPRGIDWLSPETMVSVDRYLYFVAEDETHGLELWRTDGTSSGTTLVYDLNPGPADASPSNLRLRGGDLWFTADDGRHGSELWRLDVGAHAHRLGHGCAVSWPPPALSATTPRLGSTLTIDLTGVSTTARAAALAVGIRPSPWLYLGSGCSLHVDLGGPSVVQPLALRNGRAILQAPVPALPGLHGAVVPVQAAAGPTPNAPLGLDLSNALRLAIRR